MHNRDTCEQCIAHRTKHSQIASHSDNNICYVCSKSMDDMWHTGFVAHRGKDSSGTQMVMLICPHCSPLQPVQRSELHCCVCGKISVDKFTSSVQLKGEPVIAYTRHCSSRCVRITHKEQKQCRDQIGMEYMCAKCRVGQPRMQKCSGCRTVHYCSKECQKLDWKRHKGTCGSKMSKQIEHNM